ncbi:hypothetical protein GUITHDRAFT_152550, partial [Guillardia theta CCMP2712]
MDAMVMKDVWGDREWKSRLPLSAKARVEGIRLLKNPIPTKIVRMQGKIELVLTGLIGIILEKLS